MVQRQLFHQALQPALQRSTGVLAKVQAVALVQRGDDQIGLNFENVGIDHAARPSQTRIMASSRSMSMGLVK